MKRYYLTIERKGERKKIEFDTIEAANFMAKSLKIFKQIDLQIIDEFNGKIIKC